MILGADVRVLRALGEAEALAVAGEVNPLYALSAAARAHAVDEGRLARVWLLKAVSCSRARVLMTSMSQADAGIDEEVR